jgi:hypothetical protein
MTAMEYERPLSRNILARTGLRSIDTNTQAAPVVNSDETPFVIAKRASRTSLSGRVSRMSMREYDVGLAVARQFGPVIGQSVDDRRFLPYGYGRRTEGESVDGDYDSAFL